MNILSQIEAEQSKKEIPSLRPGETVRVHVKVVEGEKETNSDIRGDRHCAFWQRQPRDLYCPENLLWHRRGTDISPALTSH